ncbi:hypothetical protein BC828DRAFT_375584 [Blastocladiella britannica]|nr:hypothetical protein BC828DRAFT_375584 [Blastocladiella britannica]
MPPRRQQRRKRQQQQVQPVGNAAGHVLSTPGAVLTAVLALSDTPIDQRTTNQAVASIFGRVSAGMTSAKIADLATWVLVAAIEAGTTFSDTRVVSALLTETPADPDANDRAAFVAAIVHVRPQILSVLLCHNRANAGAAANAGGTTTTPRDFAVLRALGELPHPHMFAVTIEDDHIGPREVFTFVTSMESRTGSRTARDMARQGLWLALDATRRRIHRLQFGGTQPRSQCPRRLETASQPSTVSGQLVHLSDDIWWRLHFYLDPATVAKLRRTASGLRGFPLDAFAQEKLEWTLCREPVPCWSMDQDDLSLLRLLDDPRVHNVRCLDDGAFLAAAAQWQPAVLRRWLVRDPERTLASPVRHVLQWSLDAALGSVRQWRLDHPQSPCTFPSPAIETVDLLLGALDTEWWPLCHDHSLQLVVQHILAEGNPAPMTTTTNWSPACRILARFLSPSHAPTEQEIEQSLAGLDDESPTTLHIYHQLIMVAARSGRRHFRTLVHHCLDLAAVHGDMLADPQLQWLEMAAFAGSPETVQALALACAHHIELTDPGEDVDQVAMRLQHGWRPAAVRAATEAGHLRLAAHWALQGTGDDDEQDQLMRILVENANWEM